MSKDSIENAETENAAGLSDSLADQSHATSADAGSKAVVGMVEEKNAATMSSEIISTSKVEACPVKQEPNPSVATFPSGDGTSAAEKAVSR